MENPRIKCNVNSCLFNCGHACEAKEITINCNCCSKAENADQTECQSFRKKA